jgi:hypothetical protein
MREHNKIRLPDCAGDAILGNNYKFARKAAGRPSNDWKTVEAGSKGHLF